MHACKYDVCIYDAVEILSPTNEQGDSRSRMQYADTYEACIYDACMCDTCKKWGRMNGLKAEF